MLIVSRQPHEIHVYRPRNRYHDRVHIEQQIEQQKNVEKKTQKVSRSKT